MNPFLNVIRSRSANTLPLGSFLLSASPIVAEAMGMAGFDWLIVDAEHSPLDVRDVASMLQALGNTPAAPVVRVPWNDHVVVKRVLDAGATTLMFPFIQSAHEATLAVQATRYPPKGIRGMAGLTRASRFGATPSYFANADAGIGVIAQLESLEAIDNLEAIAAVEGVDAVFLGPTDLAGALGHSGQGSHPQVQQLLIDTARRCKALDIPVGTLAATHVDAVRHRDNGFDFVAVGSDLGLMLGQARSWIATIHRESPEATTPASTRPAY